MKKDHISRILVVDDSSTNIVLLEAILNGQGYEIDTAQSVKEHIRLLREKMLTLYCWIYLCQGLVVSIFLRK